MSDLYKQYVIDVKGSDLINAVREIASYSPTYKYKSVNNQCLYFKRSDVETTEGRMSFGQPSCIIGWALWSLGYSDEILPGGEVPYGVGKWSSLINTREFDDFAKFYHMSLTKEEKNWLVAVQTAQDYGQTWGEAIKRADEEMANNANA